MKKKALTSWYLIAGAVVLVAVAVFLSIRMFAMAEDSQIIIEPQSTDFGGTFYIGSNENEAVFTADLIAEELNGKIEGIDYSVDWEWSWIPDEGYEDSQDIFDMKWWPSDGSNLVNNARVTLINDNKEVTGTLKAECEVTFVPGDTGDPNNTGETSTTFYGDYVLKVSYDTVKSVTIKYNGNENEQPDLGLDDEKAKSLELTATIDTEHGGMLSDTQVNWSTENHDIVYFDSENESVDAVWDPDYHTYSASSTVKVGSCWGEGVKIFAEVEDFMGEYAVDVSPKTQYITNDSLTEKYVTNKLLGFLTDTNCFYDPTDSRLTDYNNWDIEIQDPEDSVIELSEAGLTVVGAGTAVVEVNLSKNEYYDDFNGYIYLDIKQQEVIISVDSDKNSPIDKYSDGDNKVKIEDSETLDALKDRFNIKGENVEIVEIDTTGWVYESYLPGSYSISGFEDSFILSGGNENYDITLDDIKLSGNILPVEVGSPVVDLTTDSEKSDFGKVYYEDGNDVLVQFAKPSDDNWYNGSEYPLELTDEYTALGYELYEDEGCNTQFTPQTQDGKNINKEIFIKDPSIGDGVVYGGFTIIYNYDKTAPDIECVAISGESKGEYEIDFNKERLTYTVRIEDGTDGSGIDAGSIKYYIGESDETLPSEVDWMIPGKGELEYDEVNECYKLTVTVKEEGYLWVIASDIAGNQADPKSCHRPLVIESDKPKINELTELCDHKGAPAKTHSFYFAATDPDTSGLFSGIQCVIFTLTDINDNNNKYSYIAKPDGDHPKSLGELGDYKDFKEEFSLNDFNDGEGVDKSGTYKLTAVAEDFCYNESESYIFDDYIIVDIDAPTAKATTNGTVNGNVDDDGTYYYNADNAEFTFTISDNYLEYGVDCTITAVDINNKKAVLFDDWVYGQDTQPGKYNLSDSEWGLSDGEITVYISLKDYAENTSNQFDGKSGPDIKLNETKQSFYFVLDTIKPKLNSVTLQAGNYYQDEQKVYYNKTFNITYKITETNYADDLVKDETKQPANGYPSTSLNSEDQTSITVTVPYQANVTNAEYEPVISVEDKAGNKLDQTTGYIAPKDPYNNNIVYTVNSNGEVKFSSTKLVLDTVAPVLTSVTSDNGNYYESDRAVYYNSAFKVTYKASEYNYDKNKASWTFSQTGDGDAATCSQSSDDSNHIHTFTATVSRKSGVKSASYSPVLSITDKAGNVMVSNVGTTGQNGVSVSSGKSTSYTKFILDTAAPVFTMNITKLNNEALSAVDGRAYYNNGTVDVTFSVEDDHLDTGLLKSAIAENTSATNYDTATVSWVNMNTAKSTESGSSPYTMSLSINNDGVYKFEVKGEDKAGNMLAKSTAESSKSGYQSTAANGSGQYWTSYYIVRDTVNPVLDLSISDNDGVFYAAQLSSIYSVTRNMPYQSYSNATARLVKTDNSPASVAYTIDSTVRSQTESGSAYDHNDVTINFSDQQIFSITALSITDRAGNTASMNGTTNRIYLDVEHPNIDEVAPIVTLDATSTSTVRGSSGTDLYNKNVSVNATVVDPGEGVTASGLYRVYYQVLVNGDDWTGRVNVSGKGTVISEGVIGYGTSGAGYESLQGVNENITSSDVITFTFDAGTFNYNDVIIYVWAEDNSGNMLTRENAGFYNFGIDVTTPAITVRYDNNSAQNGKYFKADRVATVTITERNFDPNNTTISTQNSAVISGWTYVAGGAANGDDDSWVCTVRYHADGDYTFNVTTTDLLGHTAGAVDYGDSVAPTDFTVDETNPVITITFNNNNVMNGKYYNASRVATITVNEHNFSSTGAEITPTAKIAEGTVGTPTLGAWTSAGDTNTAQMSFSQDGDFTLKASFVDLAGNEAQMVSIDEFTIDTTAPDLEIQGVEDNTAYNGYVAPSIVYSDINYDPNSPSVSITGYYNTDGRNLEGVREDDAYGGSFICDNIEETRANDDVYIAEGTIRDLAGNETSQTVVFSVNRFGSNYILSDETEELCYDKIYVNEAENVQVTEINVNELDSKNITVDVNGEINELTEGKEYSVVESSPGWHQYDYVVTTAAFDEEGAYDVMFSSVDSAGNTSSNRAIREDDDETKDQPVEFMLDWSAPEVYITGVEENKTYDAGNRTIVINYSDNMAMDSLDLYVDDKLEENYTIDDDTIDKVSGEAEYDVQASDSAQSVWIKAVDRAGNVLEGDPLSFTVTTNGWVLYYNNKPLFFGTIAAAVVVIAAIIFFIIFFKRRKDKDENSGEQTGSPSQTV